VEVLEFVLSQFAVSIALIKILQGRRNKLKAIVIEMEFLALGTLKTGGLL
jgi:uncharacterized protein YggU (UPF0235/DUF167 family)